MHILFVNDAIKTRKISRQKINDFHGGVDNFSIYKPKNNKAPSD